MKLGTKVPIRRARGMHLGIYGGSFNPPHVAHVLVATYALVVEPFDRVLVIPCWRHPFGKPLASFEHRLAMCRLAFGDVPRVEVADVERELGGPSLTVNTLDALERRHPGTSMRLIVGSDVVGDAHKWVRFERIVDRAPLLVVGREGFPVDDPTLARIAPISPRGPACMQLPGISSTELRARLERGSPTDGLLPWRVRAYVDEHALYRADAG